MNQRFLIPRIFLIVSLVELLQSLKECWLLFDTNIHSPNQCIERNEKHFHQQVQSDPEEKLVTCILIEQHIDNVIQQNRHQLSVNDSITQICQVLRSPQSKPLQERAILVVV